MSTQRNTSGNRRGQPSRGELVALGKRLVTERLERLGCAVNTPASSRDGKLDVQTPSGRSLELFVSTQRVGGYAFWTKRRLHPARLFRPGGRTGLPLGRALGWSDRGGRVRDNRFGRLRLLGLLAQLTSIQDSAGHNNLLFGWGH